MAGADGAVPVVRVCVCVSVSGAVRSACTQIRSAAADQHEPPARARTHARTYAYTYTRAHTHIHTRARTHALSFRTRTDVTRLDKEVSERHFSLCVCLYMFVCA